MQPAIMQLSRIEVHAPRLAPGRAPHAAWRYLLPFHACTNQGLHTRSLQVLYTLPKKVRTGSLAPQKLPCRVMKVVRGKESAPLYVLRCNAGVLERLHSGNGLQLAAHGTELSFPASDHRYGKDSGVPRVSLQQAALAIHPGGVPPVRCFCRKGCANNPRCKCWARGQLCSRACGCCARGPTCDNYREQV